jgi:Asp-tRNA(Asn)/Glu-tRNA(Gln) amidotransferase A subunit family amidase
MTRKAALKTMLGAAATTALPSVGRAEGDMAKGTEAGAETEAQSEATDALTADDLKVVERIADLRFSDEERKSVLDDVTRFHTTVQRQHEASPETRFEKTPEPATVFTPRGGGSEKGAKVRVKASGVGRLSIKGKSDEDIAFLTVRELGHLIRTRQITPTRLTEIYLERLKRYGDPLLCVAYLMAERAREQAARADQEIAAGKYRGPLHGIPYGVKDLFATQGIPTEWGAAPYIGYRPDRDATVVRKLEEAGAILCAKLSVGSLAMGDRWHKGMTKNPWDPKNEREGSSGSSAGSACAVSAGLLPFAIGTETLGSITSPCRRCRVTGLRPTYGRVSRAGAMELSYTMDKAGPICRDIEDCALVLGAVCGADPDDPAAVDRPFTWPQKMDWKRLKVGYLVSAQDTTTEKELLEREPVLKFLKEKDVAMRRLTLPAVPPLCRYILTTEASAAFEALTRSGRVNEIENSSWPETFRAARYVPAVEYLQAQRLRAQLMRDAEAALGDLDLYISFARGENALTLTNLCGYPEAIIPQGTVTLPANEQRSAPVTIPASLSFIGRLYREDVLLAVAREFQQQSDFHRRRPDLSGL